jgi:hypothetical protein
MCALRTRSQQFWNEADELPFNPFFDCGTFAVGDFEIFDARLFSVNPLAIRVVGARQTGFH